MCLRIYRYRCRRRYRYIDIDSACVCITKINENKDTNLSKEGYMGAFRGRKRKGK